MSTPLLVVSPHFDDAVLSCGQWLADRPGSAVLTVFAAIPEDFTGVTPWDAACGFSDSGQALQARRLEDDAALGILQARPLRLPFYDAQYALPAPARRIGAALARVMREQRPVDALAMPLGLFHSDHVLVREACVLALRSLRRPLPVVVAYEDVPYRKLPAAVPQALDALRRCGFEPAACETQYDAGLLRRKRRALACYASQLRGLNTPGRPGADEAWQPERRWTLRLADGQQAA